MLTNLKTTRDLTILVTTHYMDEADKLCARIAIVDHGHLIALDSPLRLKAAIAGKSALDASFEGAPEDWRTRLAALPGVDSVTGEGDVLRLMSNDGPATTAALLAAAGAAGVTVQSLAIQSTTLDDVFVHYTGHDLRDALQEPAATDRTGFLRRG
jgi:ABC-2 type transport system ATP-binding protein